MVQTNSARTKYEENLLFAGKKEDKNTSSFDVTVENGFAIVPLYSCESYCRCSFSKQYQHFTSRSDNYKFKFVNQSYCDFVRLEAH